MLDVRRDWSGKLGIYRIFRLHGEEQEEYIGQSIDLAYRLTGHIFALRRGDDSPLLQAAYNQHGPDAFAIEILIYLEDEELLDWYEQFYFDTRKPLYNTAKFASSVRGTVRSPEVRNRLSASHKRQRQNPSAAQRAYWMKRKGMPLTDAQIAGYERRRNRPLNEKERAARPYWRGKKQTPETIARGSIGKQISVYGIIEVWKSEKG